MSTIRRIFVLTYASYLLVTAGGCASSSPGSSQSALPTVDAVDLDRFMGDWYVVALIPNRIEKNAHDSLESYVLRPDGKIDITYTFRDGGFDAEEKKLTMVATVKNKETSAEWRVRPFWPLSLKYLVTDLADDYRYTVIAHPSRNYVWIMAREPKLEDQDWQNIVARLKSQGFDEDRIVQVPHRSAG